MAKIDHRLQPDAKEVGSHRCIHLPENGCYSYQNWERVSALTAENIGISGLKWNLQDRLDSELSARRGRHAITAAQILGIEVAVAEMADGLKAGLDTLCNFYEPKPVPKRL